MSQAPIRLAAILAAVAAGLAATLLTGCGFTSRNAAASASASVQGTIHGGQQPVSGASVQLYAVGTASDGSAATPLLSPAQTTNSAGEFNLLGYFTCPSPTALVYLVGTGGNPGLGIGGGNPQLALMTVIGQCQTLTASTFLSVNERTTVAAAYALAPYLTSPSAIGSGTSDAAALATAFNYAQELVNPATGAVPGTGLPSGYTVPTGQLNTIADILASCINSSGGTTLASNCGTLFHYTTPFGGTTPTDPITALADLSLNPTLNTSTLFPMAAPTSPYQPMDATQPADLSISLIASSTMQLTPAGGLSFPVSGVGSSAFLTATLMNNGPGTIALYSITVSGTSASQFEESTNCPSSITSGSSCSIGITFAPTVYGTLTAQLNVSTDATNSPLSIPLSGSVVYPTISVAPTALTFPATTVGTAATAQPVVITNSGPGTLTVGTLAFTGNNPTEFPQTNNCAAPLAVSASCTVMVVMTPAGTGTRTATLSIPSNAASIATVSLTGTGTAPPPGTLILSTPSLFVAFGTPGYFNLTNIGTSAVAISSFAISPGTYFTQTNTCGTSLAAGVSCLVTVTYPTSHSALDSALLTVNNSSSTPQLNTTLFGSGYTVVDFGDAVVGTAGAIETFQAPYTYEGYTIDGFLSGANAADFSFDGTNSCLSRYSGCSILVQFTPSAAGARAALLDSQAGTIWAVTGFGVVPGNTQTPTASPTSLSFPQTALGASSPVQTVSVANPLGHLLDIIPYASPDYIVTPSNCSTNPCIVSVTFRPLTSMSTASYSFVTIFDSTTNLKTQVNMSGVGGIPSLVFNPATLNFGTVTVGATSAGMTYAVSDTGDSPAYLNFNPASGPDGSEFPGASFGATVTAGTPYTTAYATVFTPAALGTRTATISVTDSRSGLVVGTYNLTGMGGGTLTATLGASPTSLTFGSTIMGTASATQSVTITNSGNGTATIGSIGFGGTNSSDFSYTKTCGASLAVNASCSVVVTFSPGATGSRGAILLVSSNDPNSPLAVGVSGTGIPVPTVTISPSSLTFYERGVAQTVTLTNLMSTPLAISALNLSANFTQTDNCGTSLAANSSCAIQVSAGQTAGIFTGNLTVVDSDTVDPQTVALSSSVQYTTLYDFGTSSVGVTGSTTHAFTGGIVTMVSGNYTYITYTLTPSGPNPNDFPAPNGDSCSDHEDELCSLTFDFNPAAAGVRYAIVTGNDGSHYLFKGTGVTPIASFTVSPYPSYDFGTVAVGSSLNTTIYLNDTSNPISQVNLFVSGSLSTGVSNTGDFSLTPTFCALGGTNSSYFCTMTVTFKPQAAGLRSTTLTLTGGGAPTQTVQITGTGH